MSCARNCGRIEEFDPRPGQRLECHVVVLQFVQRSSGVVLAIQTGGAQETRDAAPVADTDELSFPSLRRTRFDTQLAASLHSHVENIGPFRIRTATSRLPLADHIRRERSRFRQTFFKTSDNLVEVFFSRRQLHGRHYQRCLVRVGLGQHGSRGQHRHQGGGMHHISAHRSVSCRIVHHSNPFVQHADSRTPT